MYVCMCVCMYVCVYVCIQENGTLACFIIFLVLVSFRHKVHIINMMCKVYLIYHFLASEQSELATITSVQWKSVIYLFMYV